MDLVISDILLTFRWKGENVATNEIEAVIGNAIGLKDSVVYGVEVSLLPFSVTGSIKTKKIFSRFPVAKAELGWRPSWTKTKRWT